MRKFKLDSKTINIFFNILIRNYNIMTYELYCLTIFYTYLFPIKIIKKSLTFLRIYNTINGTHKII